MMPEEGLNMLKAFDAIYFGAVGPRMSLTTSHSGPAAAYLPWL